MASKKRMIFLKRIMAIIFLVITLVSTGYSQEIEKKKKKKASTYFEIGTGLSIPQIRVKNTPYDKGKGYSHIGFNVDLNATTKIRDTWGIKYNVSMMICPADKDYIGNNYTYGYNNLKIGSWTNFHFGLGPFARLNKNNISLELGLTAGLLSSSVPVILHKNIVDNSVSSTRVLHSGFGLGFSLLPNFAIYYKITKKNYLKIFINYLFTPSKIKIKYNDRIVKDYNETHFLSNLNIGVGITF